MIESIELRPGYSISRVIKGGWQLAGDHGPVDRVMATNAMLAFVDAGIVTFDCADIYTGVEALIGAMVRRLMSERGGSSIERIKVHTKFVPDRALLDRVDCAYVRGIIDRSLQRLAIERLNLVQFHWWDYSIPGCIQTLQILESLRVEGKIERLGVTNFDAEHIEEICAAGIDLVSAQVQFSLLDCRPAGRFTESCKARNVWLLCYGVLAGGFITDSWHNKSDPGYEFTNRSLVKYRLIIDEFGGWDLFQQLLFVLGGIAQRASIPLSAVAIRYMLDQPGVGAVIIGARYARYLGDIQAAFALQLSASELASIAAILDRSQGPKGGVYALERDRDGIHGRIMKYNLNSAR